MNITVILPTYNERDNIVRLLTELEKAISQVKKHTVSIVVVDDTSPDGTADVARVFVKNHSHVSVLTGKKEGLGKALLRGMTYAVEKQHADLIVQMDADFSHDPAVVPLLISAIDDGADFAVGSRYIPGGSIPDNWGFHRKILSKTGNAIVRYGLGFLQVHDWTGGFRAYKRKYFDLFGKEMTAYSGYVFQIAFLHKAINSGARITEIPIHFSDRRYGKSKIPFVEYIRKVLEYVFRERFRMLKNGAIGKFALVGTIGFVINTIILELLVFFGLPAWLASAIGAECAIVSNYILNNNWTFKSHKITGTRQIYKFMQFNLTSIGAILIQAGSVYCGTQVFGENVYRIFYILGIGIGMLWNFTMYSKVIWKKKSA